MRVLHLTRDFPPRTNGGLSTAVGGLVTTSEAAGVESAVLSFDAWRPKARPTAPRLPDRTRVWRLSGPQELPRAAARAAEFAPDVVHVHDAMLWPAALDLPVAAPRVFSVHVVQAILRRLRRLDGPTQSERAQAAAIREAALVLVPSEAARRDVAGLYPASSAKLRVAPLGIEKPQRDRVEATVEGVVVLYAGRFADVKGTAELFEAIERVVSRTSRASFLVAGGLPDNRRAERRWRERFDARASAVAKERTRFCGWLDSKTLDAARDSAAMLVAPSWHETFGLSVAESMARGLAVVASRAGALPELVVHGETGLLVPPRDPAALAAAILELATNLDRLAHLRRGSRERSLGWTWPNRIDAFLDAYRTLA